MNLLFEYVFTICKIYDEEIKMKRKGHRPKTDLDFATQPSMVKQISVPVITEASAPVVNQVPDLAPPQVQFQLTWQIVYPLSSKLSLFYFGIHTLFSCLKGSFCLVVVCNSHFFRSFEPKYLQMNPH